MLTFSICFLLLTIKASSSCPLNPQSLPAVLSCIQTIACSTSSLGLQQILVQNCNASWYYGTSSHSLAKLISSPSPSASTSSFSSSSSFITNNQKATNIKVSSNYAMINYNDTQLFYYPLGTASYNYLVPYLCQIVDYEPLTTSSATPQVIILCSDQIATILFPNNLASVTNNTLFSSENFTAIECLPSTTYCLIGTSDGNILLFNRSTNSIETNYSTNINYSITILQSLSIENTSNFKIYASFSSGFLSQYLFINDNLELERTSTYFQGYQIYQLGIYEDSNYLIVTDIDSNASQIDLSTGILLDNVNLAMYLPKKNNIALSLLLNNQSSYFLYNTLNSQIFYAQVTPNNSKNLVVLHCLNLFYYNNTLQQCAPCSSTCTTCDPLTGNCLTCISQYFNDQGDCLSCFYNSQGLTTYFQQCISQNQQTIMEQSENLVKFLAFVVANFATFLNICGLLFIFLKLINNWHIICLYFFVPIQLPFYLQNVLSMLFNTFNSSVFETIGISFSPSFQTASKASNRKFQLTGINTDFVAMNGQPIILFVYSVILISTLYKFINHLLAKINISVFEQNSAMSIIQQFVVSFEFTLLPFYYIVFNPQNANTTETVNSLLYYLFVGGTLTIPFCFLIFNYTYKLIRSNKIHTNDQNLIAESINDGLAKRIKEWGEDDSREHFFYSVLTFSVALLACYPNPSMFLIGIGMVHLLCTINALTCKRIKLNTLIQKLSFLFFHGCFTSLYYLNDDYTKFRISLVIVLLIIFIAVHELIVTAYRKLNFVYIVVKGKRQKQNAIREFFEKNQNTTKTKNRAHPIHVLLQSQNNHSSIQHLKFKFKNFDLTPIKKTQKILPTSRASPPSPKKKKLIKTAKQLPTHPQNPKSLRNESDFWLPSNLRSCLEEKQ